MQLGTPENLNSLLSVLAGTSRGVQAIVANVETGSGITKSEDQAHAQITHAPEPAMRGSLTPERETMSERSDEER
jgi:hypothetical protein